MRVGDTVLCKVTRIHAIGVIVALPDRSEGLIHLSELANQQIEHPREVVAIGETIKAMALQLDPSTHMWALSRKQTLLANPNSTSQKAMEGYIAIAAFLGCFVFALGGTLWWGRGDLLFAFLLGFLLTQFVGWVALFFYCSSGLWFSTKIKDATPRQQSMANVAWRLGILSAGAGCLLIFRIAGLMGGGHSLR